MKPRVSTRFPVSVSRAELQPGDQLRDHGVYRTVARVEPAAVLSDTVIVVFEPDQHGDTLGVTARVAVIAWRESDPQ
jgi:hypothetical protein